MTAHAFQVAASRAIDGPRAARPNSMYQIGASAIRMLAPMAADDGTQVPGLLAPGPITLQQTDTGGTLAPSTTYFYRVSAVNGAGEALGAEVSITTSATAGNTHAVVLSWPPVAGAFAYRVYGRATGAELFMAQVTNPAFADQTGIVPAGALPAVVNPVRYGVDIAAGVKKVFDSIRGEWINWIYTTRTDVYFRLSKNNITLTDWLPVSPLATEAAIGAGVGEFRPVPAYLFMSFDRIELACGNNAQVNAMIGEGGSNAQ